MITKRLTMHPDGSFEEVMDDHPDSIELSVNAKGTVQASIKVYFNEQITSRDVGNRIQALMEESEKRITAMGLVSAAQRVEEKTE